MANNSDGAGSETSEGFILTGGDLGDHHDVDTYQLSEDELTKVREWLEPTAYNVSGSEFRKHASSHLEGTGNWLTSSSQYQQWLTGKDNGLLWIKGIPGSGKSVMAAKIISELAAAEPNAPVLYFFFRQIIQANHQPVAMLRDWMDQLLQYSPPLQRRLHSYIELGRSLASISMDDMWRDLRMAFTALPGQVYCVTDALDEMDQGNDSFLISLAALGQWRPDKVKVAITSRPVPVVEVPLRAEKCLNIRLEEDEVDVDISLFVRQTLEKSLIDQRHWNKIIQAVPGRANGLFLYARLAMDALLKTGADIDAVLS